MSGSLFDKVAGNFIKKETLAQVFSCDFCEISKNTFSYRTPLVAASAGNILRKKSIPEVTQPPEYPVCKRFLEGLLELLRDLETDHIFAYSDEQVYASLCHIIWKEPIRYQAVILLMDGFHQLRVRQETIFKRHNIMNYCKWLTDAGVVAAVLLTLLQRVGITTGI